MTTRAPKKLARTRAKKASRNITPTSATDGDDRWLSHASRGPPAFADGVQVSALVRDLGEMIESARR